MSDVFVSYARSTAKQAQAAAKALRGLGYTVWLDEELPSHRTYSDVIEEQLALTKAALVIWSAEAVKSQWVKSEANEARELDKLVQMTIDGARLPMPFGQIQCADLNGWIGNVEAPGWRKVLASIAELVGAAATPSTDTPAAAAPSPLKRASLGNLPAQATSFVGREAEVAELLALTNAHRLVTLTGVGGVGKTRLALEVARQLASAFPDGVWLVELAPVSDPAAVPDTVATALGITPHASRSIAQGIAEALSGRRLLIVLDNCEHLLDAAADLVETLLARTDDVRIIATSREGLRVGAEHLWPLPSLDTRAGVNSSAVQLFVARAQAVKSGFTLANTADADAVTQICSRLDGIALAIELAAARMVSMNPAELLARLTDRFRLLSGSRRGLERHQTLRQAVQWSYDLLLEDERLLLNRLTVFAGGFDLAAASAVCGGGDLDEYAVLDLLDSLVRKSLVTAEQPAERTRYGMLETIRQFGEEQLAASGTVDEVRNRHARYFADQAVAHWDIWDGPRQREAHDWVDTEFVNLRAGFRWAADQADLDTAAAIAAHTTALGFGVQRFEPTRWAEEVLPEAIRADIRLLPRVHFAVVMAIFEGRREVAMASATRVLGWDDDPRYLPFDAGYAQGVAAILLYNMNREADVALSTLGELSEQRDLARVVGLNGKVHVLAASGRSEEARQIAKDAVDTARAHGNPFLLANAQWTFGRAHMETNPGLALSALRAGVAVALDNRIPYWAILCSIEVAALQDATGHPAQALADFDNLIDAYQRAGNQEDLRGTIGYLAMLLHRHGRHEAAATLCGVSRTINWVIGLQAGADRLRESLGPELFSAAVDAGAVMPVGEAARYAREQIAQVQHEMAAGGALP